MTECQFADNDANLASTRPGAEMAALVYQQTTRNFGLTVSIPKTKHTVTGRLVEKEDLAPIVLEGGGSRSFHTWDLWSKILGGWMQV